MKRATTLIVFLAVIMIANFAYAQAPQGMNYQAVARDVSGAVLANQHISLQITITDSNGGPTLYQETDTAYTNQFGLFTVNVGSGTPVSGTFSAITWSTVTAWMQVDFDPAGGTSYILMGTSQLLSVPYALSAGSSSQWNSNGSDIYNANGGNVGIGTVTPSASLEINGSVKIKDGTEGQDKVLTSDATGLASWQNAIAHVGFKASTNGNQAFADASYNPVTFTTVEFDDGNNYDTTTSTFTVPSDGVYHFDINVTVDGGAGGSQCYFYLFAAGNLAAGTQQTVTSTEIKAMTISVNLKLIQGDTVYISSFPYGANSTVYFGSGMSYFSGYKVY